MTRYLLLAACLPLICNQLYGQQWIPSAGHTQIPIWPGNAPDAALGPPPNTETTRTEGSVAGRPWLDVENVSKPTMTVYSPRGKNSGVAAIVFPGGGYEDLAIDLEGTEVCDWLTSHGMTCVLLKYRVPNSGPHRDENCQCQVRPQAPLALQDAQRTMGIVRFRAAEFRIDPHKVGVVGFSAGGHLVADISTHFDKREYPAVDAADEESCRPDFAVALYPGHLRDPRNAADLSPDIPVTSRTPPTLLVQAGNDNIDSIYNSVVYYTALRNAGVPVEMHLYAEGKHAFGLRPAQYPITRWPELFETWLRTLGLISQ